MFSWRPAMRFALVVAIACLSGTPARAGAVTYTDYGGWSSAMAGTITNVTIPDPGAGTSGLGYAYFGSGNASVTYSGVTFSTSATLGNGFFFNIGVVWSKSPAVLSDQGASSGVENILTTLPGDVTGFALNYGTYTGRDVTFLLSNGDSVTQGITGSAYVVPNFFGVTDSTPFDWVLMTSADEDLDLNNVSYGTAGAGGSTIPEPATWLLLSGGLAVAAVLRRRRAD